MAAMSLSGSGRAQQTNKEVYLIPINSNIDGRTPQSSIAKPTEAPNVLILRSKPTSSNYRSEMTLPLRNVVRVDR